MLEVVNSVPENGEIEVDRYKPLIITLNKPMVSGPMYNNITLKQAGKSIQTVMQIEDTTLIITPVITSYSIHYTKLYDYLEIKF